MVQWVNLMYSEQMVCSTMDYAFVKRKNGAVALALLCFTASKLVGR